LSSSITSDLAQAALAKAGAAARVAAAAAAAVVLLLLLARVASAAEPENTISGRVVNGTEGGTVPDDFQVILLTVDEESGTVLETTTTRVDRDGSFIFEDVLLSPGTTYRVVTDHLAVTGVTFLEQGSDFTDIEAPIYDATDSSDDVVVASYSLYVPTIDPGTRTMGVLGVAMVVNDTDRVFIPNVEEPSAASAGLLRFSTPEGSTALSIETSLPQGNVVAAADGWAMTHPVPPDMHQIVFQYTVEYEGDELEFPMSLPFGAGPLRVHLAEGLGNVRVGGAAADNMVALGDGDYVMAEAPGLERDSEVTVSFEGLPTPSLMQNLSNTFSGRTYLVVIIWLGAAGIIAMLGYVFFIQRRRTDDPAPDEAEGEAPPPGPAQESERE